MAPRLLNWLPVQDPSWCCVFISGGTTTMNASEMMDSLSDSLLCDERILSAQERELLANLLQRAKADANGGDGAVTSAIARSVGEIVAQRAYGVLGESITRRLTHELGRTGGLQSSVPPTNIMTGPSPKPAPFPPGPNPPGPQVAMTG